MHKKTTAVRHHFQVRGRKQDQKKWLLSATDEEVNTYFHVGKDIFENTGLQGWVLLKYW